MPPIMTCIRSGTYSRSAAASPCWPLLMAAHSCTHAQCGMRLTGPVPPPGLQLCARCREVAYCSKDCQTQKWGSKHKKECAALRAGELTAHELKVIGKLMERFGAVDHRGVVDLTAEASEVAAVLACPPAATAGPTSPPRTRIRGSGNHNESQSAQYMRRAYAHATHFTRQSADIRPGQSRTRQCQP